MERRDIIEALRRNTKEIVENSIKGLLEDYSDLIVEINTHTPVYFQRADEYLEVECSLNDCMDICKISPTNVVYKSKNATNNPIKTITMDMGYIVRKHVIELYKNSVIRVDSKIKSENRLVEWFESLQSIPTGRGFVKYLNTTDLLQHLSNSDVESIVKTIDNAYDVFSTLDKTLPFVKRNKRTQVFIDTFVAELRENQFDSAMKYVESADTEGIVLTVSEKSKILNAVLNNALLFKDGTYADNSTMSGLFYNLLRNIKDYIENGNTMTGTMHSEFIKICGNINEVRIEEYSDLMYRDLIDWLLQEMPVETSFVFEDNKNI